MKKHLIALACIGLATIGYLVTSNSTLSVTPQNTLQAATIPVRNFDGQLPIDLQLDQAKRMKSDTVYVEKHDTVTVTNTKRVRVPVPERVTDTLYISMTDLPEIEVESVKNTSLGVREEQTQDVDTATKAAIVLTVDGKTVYSSENDNHSGRPRGEPMSVSDELK